MKGALEEAVEWLNNPVYVPYQKYWEFENIINRRTRRVTFVSVLC
jgi:hypothetical protein